MSSLETAITLEDVFTVVEAKRVPLAPELAGYLTLEIADGTDAGSGDVDAKTVFISEEGTVALVRPKRDSVTGEAEASIRRLLDKLLEASGSGTPALTAAAKRRPGNGLPALVEELEAALIPVNRAAGRRALARLAREVKRVLLGVGRNASAVPLPKAAPPARPPSREPASEPMQASYPAELRRSSMFDDEAVTAKRPNELATSLPLPPSESRPREPVPPPARREPTPPPTAELRAERGSKLFDSDEVESLVDAFGVSNANEDKQIAVDLKKMAGLSPTPPPPDAARLAELTKDVGKERPNRPDPSIEGDSVEALLALTEDSGPPPVTAPPPRRALPPLEPIAAPTALREAPPQERPRYEVSASPAVVPDPGPLAIQETGKRRRHAPVEGPRAPKTGMAMLVFALLVLVGGTIAIYWFYPQVFTGRKKPLAATAAATAEAPQPAPKCTMSLVLTDVPEETEVLLRVGQAPVQVERMPVGARLEFVATAEDHAPRRAVVHADAVWDDGPDGKQRIDVPVQLEPTKAKPGTVDPWPSAEPGTQVGGSGPPGTVNIISNVRGAEVWLLAGVGPEARIDHLRCDEAMEVLLAGPATFRKRLQVGEQEIQAAPADADGNKIVSVSAK